MLVNISTIRMQVVTSGQDITPHCVQGLLWNKQLCWIVLSEHLQELYTDPEMQELSRREISCRRLLPNQWTYCNIADGTSQCLLLWK